MHIIGFLSGVRVSKDMIILMDNAQEDNGIKVKAEIWNAAAFRGLLEVGWLR